MAFIKEVPEDDEVEIVCILILNPEDKFLLVRRSTADTRGGSWETPGGHRLLGRNAEEIDTAGMREALEETNLYVTITPGKRAYFKTTDDKFGVILMGKTTNQNVALDKKEHDKFRWCSFKDREHFRNVPDDFWKEIRFLLKGRKIASIGEIKMAEKVKQVIEGTGTDAIFQISNTVRPFEALWKLSGLKRPDFANFSCKDVPDTIKQKFPSRTPKDPDEQTIDVTQTLHELLDKEKSSITKASKKKAYVTLIDPQYMPKVKKIASKHNFAFKQVSPFKAVVAVGPPGLAPIPAPPPPKKPVSPVIRHNQQVQRPPAPQKPIQQLVPPFQAIEDAPGVWAVRDSLGKGKSFGTMKRDQQSAQMEADQLNKAWQFQTQKQAPHGQMMGLTAAAVPPVPPGQQQNMTFPIPVTPAQAVQTELKNTGIVKPTPDNKALNVQMRPGQEQKALEGINNAVKKKEIVFDPNAPKITSSRKERLAQSL